MLILAIESSCDETAAAVVRMSDEERTILSNRPLLSFCLKLFEKKLFCTSHLHDLLFQERLSFCA